MGNAVEIIGQRYGRLTVISRASNDKNGRAFWNCKCDCGNIVVVRGSHLRSGNTQSCGCLSSEALTQANSQRASISIYDKRKTKRLRNIRDGMIKRCCNPDRKDYPYYGGRGIKICNEWFCSFKSFHDWAVANGYQDKLTIDRINVNGDYEPENCRWVTMSEQNMNKRHGGTSMVYVKD